MGPCVAVEGATTGVVFETYVEKVLAPTLRHGQVVVMDNLQAHNTERVRELIEARGCELLYLPPYLPDFSPIERNLYVNVKPQTGSRTWFRHAASPTLR
jgi:transposase